jgi:hypothetical protein
MHFLGVRAKCNALVAGGRPRCNAGVRGGAPRRKFGVHMPLSALLALLSGDPSRRHDLASADGPRQHGQSTTCRARKRIPVGSKVVARRPLGWSVCESGGRESRERRPGPAAAVRSWGEWVRVSIRASGESPENFDGFGLRGAVQSATLGCAAAFEVQRASCVALHLL